MTAPLMGFAVFCVWIWYNWDPTGIAGHGWVGHLLEKPGFAAASVHVAGHDTFAQAMHAAHIPGLLISLVVAGAGIWLAYTMFRKGSISLEAWRESDSRLYRVLANKYYVDEFYQKTIIGFTFVVATIAAIFDKLVIDGIVNGVASISERFSMFSGKTDHRVVDGLVNGVADVTRGVGDRVRRVQTGRVQNYLVFAVLGAIVLILIAR